MPLISYAQNREDVVLARAFPGPTGFYIDVGAGSPVSHSVTKHFYDLGWRGINIEPAAVWIDQLIAARPHDVNLQLGVSDTNGTLEFYDVTDVAADESTFSHEVAAALRSRGIEPTPRVVPVQTLADICATHVTGRIDFLKIDVEGWEPHVIAGADWERFRPIVVVVESTRAGTPEVLDDSVAAMEVAGYGEALFDGLNRFYVRNEDHELAHRLGTPANVFDDYVLAEVSQLTDQLAASERAREQTVAQLETVTARLTLSHSELRDARRLASDAEIQFQATRQALERLLADSA